MAIPSADRASFLLDQHLDQQQAGGRERASVTALEPLMDRAAELGVNVRPLSYVSRNPAKDICDVADVKEPQRPQGLGARPKNP